MNREQNMVKEFHKKFGFTISEAPTIVDTELGLVRHKHTLEEMGELENAILEGDIIKIADALGDLLYFIYGTGVAYGIPLGSVFKEIHRSNMSKERPDPTVYIDAKAVKGEDYSPPNLNTLFISNNGKEKE